MRQDDRLEIEVLPGETRAFLWLKQSLCGLAVERDGAGLRAGDRAVGRVRALDRRLNAAFVTLPAGPDGLLPFNAAPGLSEGDAVAVRVSRAAVETKGPKLALDAGQPPAAPAAGPVPRLVARGPGALEPLLSGVPVLCDDAARAAALRAAGHAVTILPLGFDAAAQAAQDAAVEACLRPVVPLASGSLVVEVGRTLTAIDLNTGAEPLLPFVALAAREIPRQITLRGLAGRFVVDVPDGEPREVDRALRLGLSANFAFDPARTKLIGWSRGGLFEFTRRRLGPSLYDTLMEPAPYGGWQKQPLTLALEAARAYDRARRRAPAGRRRLVLRPDLLALWPTLPAAAWVAERAGQAPRLAAGGPEPWRLEEEGA